MVTIVTENHSQQNAAEEQCYLMEIKRLIKEFHNPIATCLRTNVLLIADEAQTGIGVTVRRVRSLKKVKGKDKTGESAELVFANKHNYPRRPKELTWQEWAGKDDLGDEPYSRTKLLLAYLLRVHGVDFSNNRVISDKMVENDWELNDWELNGWELNDWELNDWELNDWELNDWELDDLELDAMDTDDE
ncbi:hypothetical protein N7516_008324 [Penicillium verrucosum]|uniref:uncharacterized protein n=1 Tax=Penicillium verrucosum TaxID=60171 RepID=UPI00254597A9|nr:uncharacterized protein N7516_008324 [Penicillium verrucosum]KAJ5926551.1 hypothetical protein N7516_008324 [Penicillium verrucosum]